MSKCQRCGQHYCDCECTQSDYKMDVQTEILEAILKELKEINELLAGEKE